MKLDELLIIKEALIQAGYIDCDYSIVNKAQEIIDKELNCKCLTTKISNPACREHGVAQQLNKSQME